MTNRFVVADPNKCIGCRTCEIACAVAHAEQDIFTVEPSQIQFQPRLNVIKTARVSAPIQCRQCEDAQCINVCPVKAITRKVDYISINNEICIGCKTCLMACRIGAIELVSQYKHGEKILQERLQCNDGENFYEGKDRIVAIKCDLCVGREKGPACMEVCPTSALKIVNYEDIQKSHSRT